MDHEDSDYFGTFDTDVEQQYMLSGDEKLVKMSYSSGIERETEINIFEVRNLTEIARFGKSALLKDAKARVWKIPKQEGLFPMGMVMTDGKEESFGLVIQPKHEYYMSTPWSYNYISAEDGFTPEGKSTTLHFWTANCPPNFVGLGTAVTKSAENRPATGTHYCIHQAGLQI